MSYFSARMILYAFSMPIARRVCRKVIRGLQDLSSGGLSGDDSPLCNVWDEWCVQVQYEESPYWTVYLETVDMQIVAELEFLPKHELGALWLMTDEALEWESHDVRDREENPVQMANVARYLRTEYLQAMAKSWSNPNIRRYLRHIHEVD